jgi:hypothetical protein
MIRSSFEWILYGLNHKNPLISCFISQKIHLHHKISTQYINKPMNNILASRPALYRIGAVSKLSGVPVPTLRVWQTRYNAFTPATSQGQHRLSDWPGSWHQLDRRTEHHSAAAVVANRR